VSQQIKNTNYSSKARDYIKANNINPVKVILLNTLQSVRGLHDHSIIELPSSKDLKDIIEIRRVLKLSNCEIIKGK
jgi:hypothetical protein